MDRTFVGFGFGAIQGGLFLPEAFGSGNFSRLVVSEIDTEVVVAVPQRNGLAAGDTDGALRVTSIERTGERDDPDADGHSMTSIPTTSSITEFERISSAIR